MITVNDIKKEVMRKLHNKFPSYTFYSEEIPSDFKRPSFFIYFVPVETLHNNKYYYTTSLMIKIDHYSASKTDRMDDNWTVSSQLEQLFHGGFSVEDSYMSVMRTNNEVIEDILTYTISIQFNNGIEMVEVINDEGETQVTEADPELGYTEGNVKIMRDLEYETESE